MLNQVGSSRWLARVGVGRAVDAAVVAREQNARRAGHEGERVLIDVHDVATAVAAGECRSRQAIPVLAQNQTSKVSKKTRSGLFGSTAMPWSYQFCG